MATPVSLGTSNNGGIGSGVSSETLTTTGNILSGDLVVVGIALNINAASSAVSSVSDGTNSYARSETTTDYLSTVVELWTCPNASAVGSGATITVNFTSTTGPNNFIGIVAARIPGTTNQAADQVAENAVSSSATVTATTATLSSSSEIAIGVGIDVVGSSSAPSYSGASGFSNLSTVGSTVAGNSLGVSFDYQSLASTAAVSYSPTWGTSGVRVCAVVATFYLSQSSSPAGTFPPFALSEHPPIPLRPAAEFQLPVQQQLGLLLRPQFSPTAFQANGLVIDTKHPPPYAYRAPEFIFPPTTLYFDPTFSELAKFRNSAYALNPPVSWRFPEPIFPNVALTAGGYLLRLEYVQENATFIVDYKHPPRDHTTPELLWPNLALVNAQLVIVPRELWPFDFYRHPPPNYYRSEEFFPVNFLAKHIPGIPVPVTAQFIRNFDPELTQIRSSDPELTQIRVSKPTLRK